MKRRILSVLLLAAVLLLCGCGAKPGPEAEVPAAPDGEIFTFAATDLDGSPVASADFADARVIMVNLWEPWCGPCVNEMPDLQQLYTKYQAQGFVILGVTTSPAADAKETVSRIGVTYPVVQGNAQFSDFETGYVPTTVFLDGEGHLLSAEPYVGGRSAAEWETIILSYLQG